MTHVAHARDAQQRVVDVDDRVVGQEVRVVAAVGRVEAKRRSAGTPADFLIGDAEFFTSCGKLRLGLREAVLHEHVVDVDVGADVERDVWVIVPSLALIDCMYSMLSTPFICCSIGVATDCSMVSASAPV